MAAVKSAWLQRLGHNYVEQVPGIAANLTTAAILFAGAVLFQPWLQRVFSPPAVEYPISCSADPISVDASTGRTRSAFFIINHTDKELDGEQLAKRLAASTGDQTTQRDTDIALQYGGYNGKFLAVRADDKFNGDKGELAIVATPDSILIQVKRIAAAAVLKVDIVAVQSPAPALISPNTKAALPFDNTEYEIRCYKG